MCKHNTAGRLPFAALLIANTNSIPQSPPKTYEFFLTSSCTSPTSPLSPLFFSPFPPLYLTFPPFSLHLSPLSSTFLHPPHTFPLLSPPFYPHRTLPPFFPTVLSHPFTSFLSFFHIILIPLSLSLTFPISPFLTSLFLPISALTSLPRRPPPPSSHFFPFPRTFPPLFSHILPSFHHSPPPPPISSLSSPPSSCHFPFLHTFPISPFLTFPRLSPHTTYPLPVPTTSSHFCHQPHMDFKISVSYNEPRKQTTAARPTVFNKKGENLL